jgi:hypothetical protein
MSRRGRGRRVASPGARCLPAARRPAARAHGRARAPSQVGLPEDELATRGLTHRGVYCRAGLLIPSDTTVYALCPAQARRARPPPRAARPRPRCLARRGSARTPRRRLRLCVPRRDAACAPALRGRFRARAALQRLPAAGPQAAVLGAGLRRCGGHAGVPGARPARARDAPSRGRSRASSPASPQDTATLCALANLTHRAAGDTRAFYVLQLELDLLIPAAREEEEEADGAVDAASPGAQQQQQQAPGAAARGRGNLRIMGAVNEEAITRMWLARRDARGGFLTCDAPNGAPPVTARGEGRRQSDACALTRMRRAGSPGS